jgi:Zn finger protein HypA/HybF involved in hydrogenase expression
MTPAALSKETGNVSIWCAGSSEKVYTAARSANCPKCGKLVELTRQGHIKPHIERKTATPSK